MTIDLTDARLYLCTEARPDFAQFVTAAYAGGVDIIQLRDKTLEAADELELLGVLRAAAETAGKLWAVNDRADIAAVAGAPVFHGGQRDLPLAASRRVLGDEVAVGLSTHTREQIDAAVGGASDYFCVGPVWATPTKPGRTAVGLDLVSYAASIARPEQPWFAIGGIDQGNVADVVAAGAQRIVVVRAITGASDVAAAASALREALG